MGAFKEVYTGLPLFKDSFLSQNSKLRFSKGASSLDSFLFSLRHSFFGAWASAILMYLVASARKLSNLEADFLTKDLKKSSSRSAWKKALALTS
ncbi:UNVERIFIED_CONTAM: hypothetical protein Sradi_1691000 [Sesamum radiatum]|uniref:Uncharacterized protein n=1 Tax=Sesamum radiatum TaxID=300843 RepID=A0AAW2UDM1_SESRA